MFPEFIHFLQHYAEISKSMNNNSLSHVSVLTFINIVRHRAIFVHLRTKHRTWSWFGLQSQVLSQDSNPDFVIHA
ncbi:MAG: hypothetical protein B6D61_01240 [Bacteroidetes bacterium 4484_249]|nr:MAG: hypothetical protein B6D61_01240 [Bacteroidetes bacterium 4484_249]